MFFSQTSLLRATPKYLPPTQSYDIYCSSSEIWRLVLNLRRASKSNVRYLRILLWFPLACLLVLIIISVFLCYMSVSRTGLTSSLSYLAKWPRRCRFQQSKSNSSWSTHLDEVHSQLFDGTVKHAISLKSSCCVLSLVSLSFWYVCDVPSPALWQWTLPLSLSFPLWQLVSVQFHPQI